MYYATKAEIILSLHFGDKDSTQQNEINKSRDYRLEFRTGPIAIPMVVASTNMCNTSTYSRDFPATLSALVSGIQKSRSPRYSDV